MISWIKTKLVIIELIVIVGLILYIAISKNITVNQTYNTSSTSNSTSNAYSSSSAINETTIFGNTNVSGEWTLDYKEFKNHDEVLEFYKSLDPLVYKWCKESYGLTYRSKGAHYYSYCWYVTYPIISKVELTESKTRTKKVVNGKEIK